MWNQLLGLGHL